MIPDIIEKLGSEGFLTNPEKKELLISLYKVALPNIVGS